MQDSIAKEKKWGKKMSGNLFKHVILRCNVNTVKNKSRKQINT